MNSPLRGHSVLDVSGWPRNHPDHRDPMWWGIFGVIAIEVTTVGAFLISYFYLGFARGAGPAVGTGGGLAAWPPPHVAAPPLLYPSIDTVLLLACGFLMWLGSWYMKRGNAAAYVWTVVATAAASLAVLYLRWLQFHAFPVKWNDSAYGSILWTLTGFHFFHVTSALIGTVAIGVVAAKGYYTKKRQITITVDTYYWYFVVLIWIPIYLTLYWTPRL